MTTPIAPIASVASLGDDTLTALREALAAAGYDHRTIAEGEKIFAGPLDALRLPFVWAQWRDHPSPARNLALLFCYDAAVPWALVAEALGEPLALRLTEAGLLAREGADVRAAMRLTPFRGLWILSDPLHLGADVVMGPGPTTDELAEAMPERPGRVLDVGCGAGSLALVAAARGGEVVGVDISPRAVVLATMNARLNGLAARFVESDLTAAVAGERFDLVVSQPAFIAQPPDVDGATFAHGGAFGDELVMRLVGELPAVLARGGAAMLLVESARRAGAPSLHARLREQLRAPQLALLTLTAAGIDVDAYSAAYASLSDPALGAPWRDAALRYRAHLRSLHIEGFTRALILVEDLPRAAYDVTFPLRALRGFDGEALTFLRRGLSLAARVDDEILGAAVRASPNVVWVEEREHPDSSIAPRWVARYRRGGFTDRELSEASWVLLGIIDGAPTVADAVRGYAEVCDATPDDVRAQVLGFVRDGLARGLLVPSR